MATCWASSLGDCSEKLSREHYFSKMLLGGKPVRVQGLPWYPIPKVIPANGLVRKMLCTKHNSELSPVDEAGSEAWVVLQKFSQVQWVRRTEGRKQKQRVDGEIDGLLLERWMLKFLIGIAYDHIELGGTHWQPPESWVDICFGRQAFERRCGLYVGPLSPKIKSLDKNRTEVNRYPKHSEQIEGADFNLNGLQFRLALTPLKKQATYKHRPPFLRDYQNGKLQQLIKLKW